MAGSEKDRIDPLTKLEVLRIRKVEAALGAFQDEKLDIYKDQLGHMAGVFEQAREVRSRLQEDYDQRNQLIMDKLAAIRDDMDARTRVHLEKLKQFSAKWDEDAISGKKNQRAMLTSDLNALGRRHAASITELGRLDDAIQQEVQDCQEHTTAETGPIKEKLQEHSDFLERQIGERYEQQKEFEGVLADRFRVLRKKLKQEGEVADKQLAESQVKLEQCYSELHSRRDQEAVVVVSRLEEIRTKLREQAARRADAQAMIAKDMVHFMAQFEHAIEDMNKTQMATSTKLQTMKNTTHFSTMV